MTGSQLTLQPLEDVTEEVRELIAALDEALSEGYTAEQHHGYAAERLLESNMRFFLLREANALIGCGGYAVEVGFGELKRMFVSPSHQGRGHSKRILSHLIEHARAEGVALLRLETGVYQTTAIKLYKSFGFKEIKAFGEYREMDPHTIELSRFYELRL